MSEEELIEVKPEFITISPKQFHMVIQGDVRKALTRLPDESVDCVVTSPPYWGLRDYKIESSIWDGDDSCEHEWAETDGIRRSWGNSSRLEGSKQGTVRGAMTNVDALTKHSDFCSKCLAWKGQLGLEPTFQLYVKHIVEVFHDVRRVLKKSGSLWLNLGDTYYGGKGKSGAASADETSERFERGETFQKGEYEIGTDRPQNFPQGNLQAKCLIGIPWRVALAMIDDGWILRNSVIWSKPNHMPSSVKDRLSNGYEFIFHFVQNGRYFYDLDAVREPHSENYLRENRPAGILRQKLYPNSRERYSGTGDPHLAQFTGDPKIEKTTGELTANPLGKNPGDVWTITTQPFPEAHFATFPEKLVERPIKASCPAEVCVKCGKARERITKTDYIDDGGKIASVHKNDDNATTFERGYAHKKGGFNEWLLKHGNQERRPITQTLGWTICSCPEKSYYPGIVLDPFAGSGTVALVAKNLQRSSISIEVNPEYVEMLKRRIDFGAPTIDSGIKWIEIKS